MIKEQDYPNFCKPEGKEKFEQFVKDYKICAPSKLPRSAHYELFREARSPERKNNSVFDHMSFWMTDKIHRVYYAVSQPYANKESAMQALQNDIPLRRAAAKYGYKISLFDDERYNWHNDGCVFILFQLNGSQSASSNQIEAPLLKIETE